MLSLVCRSGLLCWAGTLVCHACLPCWSAVLMSVGGGFMDMGGGCGGSARPVPLQVPCDTKKAMLSLVCRSGLPRWPGTLVCRACLPCWSAVLVCRACLCWVLDSSVIVFAFVIKDLQNITDESNKPSTNKHGTPARQTSTADKHGRPACQASVANQNDRPDST